MFMCQPIKLENNILNPRFYCLFKLHEFVSYEIVCSNLNLGQTS